MQERMTLSWITYETFDPSKVSIVEKRTGTIMRKKVMYDNGDLQKELTITVPKNKENYLICTKVKKSYYNNVETNKHQATFCMNGDNPNHGELYQTLFKLKERLDSLLKADTKFPVVEHDNNAYIFANLIESGDGTIYTKAYTNDKHMNVLECGMTVVRPAFTFSITQFNNIKINLIQMFVEDKIDEFPLSIRD